MIPNGELTPNLKQMKKADLNLVPAQRRDPGISSRQDV